jgi:membrane fusion protein, heavy metal efflux system
MRITDIIREKYQRFTHEQRAITLFILGISSLIFFIFFLKGIHQTFHFLFKKNPEPLLVREKKSIYIPPHSALRNEITTEIVQKIKQPHTIVVPGIIEADPARTVNIYPPLVGRLTSLHVKLGDYIKKDQLLAEIQSADLATATADYKRAEAASILAETALTRAKKVFSAGGNTVKDLQIAENDYHQTIATLHQTEARLKVLGDADLNTLKIVAPIEGRITDLNFGLGSYLNDVMSPLLTISNIDQIWVTANVPETLAGVVEKNQSVSVFLPAYPSVELHGKISFVSAYLEPSTRRNKTRITFDNPRHKLQPNMFASVHIQIKQPNIIMIPVSSILMSDDTTSVFVETSPWTFIRRDIQIGLEDTDRVRVLSGLKPGERIITDGGVLIND